MINYITEEPAGFQCGFELYDGIYCSLNSIKHRDSVHSKALEVVSMFKKLKMENAQKLLGTLDEFNLNTISEKDHEKYIKSIFNNKKDMVVFTNYNYIIKLSNISFEDESKSPSHAHKNFKYLYHFVVLNHPELEGIEFIVKFQIGECSYSNFQDFRNDYIYNYVEISYNHEYIIREIEERCKDNNKPSERIFALSVLSEFDKLKKAKRKLPIFNYSTEVFFDYRIITDENDYCLVYETYCIERIYDYCVDTLGMNYIKNKKVKSYAHWIRDNFIL